MNRIPQKLSGESLDTSAENRLKLKKLFPSVFTETINNKGLLKESIDFEKLKAELGTFTDLFEGHHEHYGMEWPGKKDALRLIQIPITATLKPSRTESLNFDTTENLFIEGENLEVLKLLQKSYYGKVKMIYIDPPYNTGNDFIYSDNFNDSLDAYLKYAGLVDGHGKKLSTNTANEGRFHTKWLNMMYPRLYLAKNLLRDDGVIFISIDDNEVSNLRKLCDEIFGEENFVAQAIWQRRVSSAMTDNNVSADHDYVLCYQKNELVSFYGFKKDFKRYANPDNDSRGPWILDNLTVGMTSSMRPNQAYDLIDPKSGKLYPFNPNRVWAFIPETMNKMIHEGRIVFPNDITKRPMQKRFQNELKSAQNPFSTLLLDHVGLNTEATRTIQEIMDGNIFEYSKPISLLKTLLQQVTSKDDIILDFFAGSATTAHAVLDLNKQDGGNRKFILVQLPEPCAPDSEAFKADYKTIADIGKERIRRVIKRLNEEDNDKLKAAQGKKPIDRGFKVLKLNKSNFKQWQKIASNAKPDIIEKQLEMHIDHINQKATAEDLLYEILLKEGIPLTEKIEIKMVAGKQLFSVTEGKLLLCLADAVTKELIDSVITISPELFICLDSAFRNDDQLKANAVLAFSSMSNDEHFKTNFKTI